ncbi:MAG: amino acid/peptide transporter [Candidatus Midichloriaceae bacterium]|jgi:POT family proton-dependent oligopeptide transporter|nr:amino acid/peptide transporter [Candidatus Midichloriaceae bacterium]
MQRDIKQPKALYLLFFVQMWEAFSFYGMRAILVLYMVSELGLSDMDAFGIYAVSTALSEALAVIGGKMGDRVFGLKYSIYLGGVIIALGHIVMSIPGGMINLYLGMGLIAVGTSFLRPNCTALLGEFYKKDDVRRDAGYTMFYVGLNLGAFLSTIGCAFAADLYGWHYGFSLAAFGMALGLLGLFKFNYILENKGKRPAGSSLQKVSMYTIFVFSMAPFCSAAIYLHEISIYCVTGAILATIISVLYSSRTLDKTDKSNVYSILAAIFLLALFYGFEEQVGSTLILFAERFSDKSLFGFEIPVASITTVNPVVILLLGPIVAILMEIYEAKTKREIKLYSKVALAFCLQAIAFAVLYYSAGDNLVSANTVGLSFGIIAFSELFIGPAVYAHCAKYSPNHMRGVLMGSVMLGYALANLFSGALSKYMAIDELNADLGVSVYTDGFLKILIMCFVASAVLLILSRRDKCAK